MVVVLRALVDSLGPLCVDPLLNVADKAVESVSVLERLSRCVGDIVVIYAGSLRPQEGAGPAKALAT